MTISSFNKDCSIAELDFDSLPKCSECGQSPCESFLGKRCPTTGRWPYTVGQSSATPVEDEYDPCADGHCDCYYDGHACCDCGEREDSYDDDDWSDDE